MSLRAWWVVAAAVPLAAASGCGSDVVFVSEGPSAGQGGDGGFLFLDGGGGQGGVGGEDDPILPDFEDPGCPDQPPPFEDFQCDPYAQGNGDCPLGDGCFIYVDYPNEPCGQESYGAFCAPAGPNEQGEPCGGALDCAAGHVCVVTGAGTQCVQLCPLTGPDGCPGGLVCEPIDVQGFGGCL